LTLGGGEVTPLDLTTAYNTLANDGEFVPATPILKITDRVGNELPYSAGQRRQAVDPKYVAIVRDFMGDNEARVPLFGRENPLNPSRRAHAKTGTTEDFRDAWAVGYTPYVTVGVWTGNNNNEKTAKVESTVGGGIIWNRIMEALFANPELDNFLRDNGRIPLEFPDPKTFGLEERRMCQLGGRMGQRTKEWFAPGQNNGGKIDCDLTKLVTVAYDKTGMCLVPPGVKWNARQFKAQVSSLSPATDEEMIVNTASENGGISGGRAPERVCGGGDLANALAAYGVTNVPVATPAPAQAPATAQPDTGGDQSSGDAQLPTVQEPAAPAPVQQAPARAPRQVAPVPTAARPVIQQPRVQPPSAQQRPTQQPPAQQRPVQQPVRQPPAAQAPPVPKPAPTTAPAGPSMPSLVGLGENQARGILANLGVTSVVVDYQGRERLGALYDKFPAYAVVSHSPAPGTPIKPGMRAVLGVRGP
jgi:peptidoglycan glycosyltransferase